MANPHDIAARIQAARAGAQKNPADPYEVILDNVRQGLAESTPGVEVIVRPGAGGRRTFWLWPQHRPGRAHALLSVILEGNSVRVMTSNEQRAATPAELGAILETFVAQPEVVETLDLVAGEATRPVEGFLRVRRNTVSRGDVMLDVPVDVQSELATREGAYEVALRIADFPGAGTLDRGLEYTVLESAGCTLELTEQPVENDDGSVQLVGLLRR